MNFVRLIGRQPTFLHVSLRLAEQRRAVSTLTARELLRLSQNHPLTTKDLRTAYFEAAKRCHPDTSRARKAGYEDTTRMFIRVTEAYELLQRETVSQSPTDDIEVDDGISQSEEEQFREACQEWLGVPAEIVEESKRCPLFREWLQGKTDAAFTWRLFFCHNGGLAPKLRPPAALIGEGVRTKGPNRRRQPR